MKHHYRIVLASIILIGSLLFGQAKYGGELYVTTNDGLSHTFTLQAVGTVYGHMNTDYAPTSSYDYISQTGGSLLVHHIHDAGTGPELAFGKYKLTLSTSGYSNHYLYVDFRDCDYLDGTGDHGTGYSDGDIQIFFDINRYPTFYHLISGSQDTVNLYDWNTFPIWHSTNKSPASQSTSCFPPTVSISGPTSLAPGVSGTFTANVTGLNTPISYQWYRRIECLDLDKNPDGSKDTPCGKWYAFGSNTATVQSSAWQDFSLKCKVTDSSNNTDYDTHYISVSSDKKTTITNQNAFPNPFNSSTLITFRLHQSSNVSIKIYNIRGQIVKNLADNIFSEGQHSINWDGKNDFAQDLNSGLYLCHLYSDNINYTIKLLLAK